MVNITKFFLISQSQFEDVIINLNLDLTSSDSIYLLTYLVANIYAMLSILISIWAVMWLVNLLFKRKNTF